MFGGIAGDIIPPLVEKKYLKTVYRCHECAGTLDSVDADGDGDGNEFSKRGLTDSPDSLQFWGKKMR